MYCEKCGTQIDDDSVFCQNCGAKQSVILSDHEEKEKSDNAKMTEKEILGNTYPNESIVSVKKEQNNDIDQDKNKKKKINRVVGIIVGVILILIGLGLAVKDAIFYGDLFKSNDIFSKSDYERIVREHMHDVHKVSMDANESFDETQVDLHDTGAMVRFKVYRSVDGIYLEMPNTMQLDKKGKVVSCEWCRLGISDEQDNITSANLEPNPNQTSSRDESASSQHPNDSLSDSTCPRCGRTLADGETCDCTWCDICNAWMLGHGHGEGENPVGSSTSQNSNDSSIQNGTGSTDDFVPVAPEVLSVTPRINADGEASILLDITISDLSLGEQSPSHYNAGENLTITVNGTKVNHKTAWWGGKKWQIQIDNINLSDTKTFTIVLTNKYGLSTTRTVTFS